MDGADLELFERSLRHATERHTGAELDAALAELGWTDAAGADRRTAVSLLFELQGRTNVTSSTLDLVLLAALGRDDATAGVVLSPIGRSDPPGAFDDDGLRVEGLATAALATRATAVVVASAGGAALVATVPPSQLRLEPVEGLDPALGLVRVSGEALTASTSEALGTDAWDAAVAAGRVAIAHELVGAARAMLELARDHARDRVQFGRPIASFQAVRHRLAEALVAVETADAALDAAWLEGSPASASMAKASAGRAARAVGRHCQQVLAGIGFTTEHPLHLYVKRTLVLDPLLGGTSSLTRDLGEQLLASRQLPPLLPL